MYYRIVYFGELITNRPHLLTKIFIFITFSLVLHRGEKPKVKVEYEKSKGSVFWLQSWTFGAVENGHCFRCV